MDPNCLQHAYTKLSAVAVVGVVGTTNDHQRMRLYWITQILLNNKIANLTRLEMAIRKRPAPNRW